MLELYLFALMHSYLGLLLFRLGIIGILVTTWYYPTYNNMFTVVIGHMESTKKLFLLMFFDCHYTIRFGSKFYSFFESSITSK